jgi:hypothetical protein
MAKSEKEMRRPPGMAADQGSAGTGWRNGSRSPKAIFVPSRLDNSLCWIDLSKQAGATVRFKADRSPLGI